jgi:hypothetical protein
MNLGRARSIKSAKNGSGSLTFSRRCEAWRFQNLSVTAKGCSRHNWRCRWWVSDPFNDSGDGRAVLLVVVPPLVNIFETTGERSVCFTDSLKHNMCRRNFSQYNHTDVVGLHVDKQEPLLNC